jgi:alpha-galactosidase
MSARFLFLAGLPAIVLSLDNGLSLTPAMGWNSWLAFGCNGDNMTGSITAQIITETADAMVSSGLSKKGYQFVNLDDCWLKKGRDKNGDLQVDQRAFPGGLEPVISHVHKLGLKFGLYLSNGNATCQGREGSWGHEQQDAQYLAKLGVDYLKYDNCAVDRSATWSDPKGAKGVQTRYARMGEALNKTGRPIVYSICCPYDPQFVASKGGWVGGANASDGGGNSWRIGCDMPGASFGIVEIVADVAADWGKHSQNGYDGGRPQIGPGKWIDPDAFNLGNGGQTEAEEKTYFSLWCLLRAPLLMGNDIRNMSEQTLAIYGAEEVIAVDQSW